MKLAPVDPAVVFSRLGMDAVPETDLEWRMTCPFHQDHTPSFYVNVPDQVYYCFGCGAKGGLVDMLMDLGRLDFLSAMVLAARMGASNGNTVPSTPKALLALPEYTLRTFQPIRKQTMHPYLRRRGLDFATVEAFGLRWHAETQRIVIPVRTDTGTLTGFVFREIDDAVKPKYKYSVRFAKSLVLFNLDRVVRHRWPVVVLVEGTFDVMALFNVRIPCGVATLGGATSDAQVQLLRKHNITQALLAFDADEAGRGYAAITKSKLAETPITVKEVMLPPGVKDVAACAPSIRYKLFAKEVRPWLLRK